MTKLYGTSAAIPTPSAEALKTDATNRALSTFLRTVGRETTKANKLEFERRKAFGETINAWIESLDEDARAGFFASIEAIATASNAKKIASHPLRPDGMPQAGATANTDTPIEAPSDKGAPSGRKDLKAPVAETAE
ncbi:MAG: hypothetical protein P8X51_12010 [Maritimibacter sp.]